MREEQKRQLSEQLSKKQQSGKLQNAILTDKNISGFRENSLDTTDIPEKQMDDAEKEYYKKSSFADRYIEVRSSDREKEQKLSERKYLTGSIFNEVIEENASDAAGEKQRKLVNRFERRQMRGADDLRQEMIRQLGQDVQDPVSLSGTNPDKGQEIGYKEDTAFLQQPESQATGISLTGLRASSASKKDVRKEARKEAQREAQKEAVRDAAEEQAENGENVLGHVFSAVKNSAKIAVTTTSRILTAPSAATQKVSRMEQIKNRVISMEVDRLAYDAAVHTTNKVVRRSLRSVVRAVWKVIREFLKKELMVILLFFPVAVYSLIVLFLVLVAENSGETYRLTETTAVESSTSGVSSRSEAEIVNGYVFYNQGDYQNAMGVGSDGRVRTIAGSGCGLTAIASALCKHTGRTDITPETVLTYALNGASGSRCSIVLVSSSLITGLCSQYGLTYNTIIPKSRDELRAALNAGKSVIVLLSNRARWCNGNYVTSNTHYIVLMGYTEDGTIMCMNPAGGTLCYITEDTVVNDTGTDTFHVIYKE